MNFHSVVRIPAILLLSGLVLAGCATSGRDTPVPELLQRIESARTRVDHESLATIYDQKAASARADAANHRKMATSYQGAVGGGRSGASMPAHCNAIARSQDAIAAEYESMATAHRQLAKQIHP